MALTYCLSAGEPVPADLWAIAIANGKPKGTAFIVRRDVGLVTPTAMTNDGSYYYMKAARREPTVSFADLTASPATPRQLAQRTTLR